MKKFALIVCSIILVLGSCKKKQYPDNNTTGSPEFYVKASVDGQPLILQAGTLDYYMYSSYDQNVDGVYSFVANVKQKNCSSVNCPNSIKIEFFDDQSSTQNGSSNINTSIKPGSYQFVNSNTTIPTVVGYAVTYRGSFNMSGANTYSWNFGYGAPLSGTVTSPTHTYATAGVYNVKFAAFDGVNWTEIWNPIKVTTNPNACKAQILASPPSGNTINFTSQISGSGNYSRLWEFGDGSTSVDIFNPHIYPDPGRYCATLTVVDLSNTNDTARHHYWVNTDLYHDPAPNFYAEKVAPILSNSPISKIKITYTDGTGTVYYSDIDPQDSNSSNFQIISVEDYKTNENNQATKKVKITFNCRLSNGVSAIPITNGEAVIAVAYK